MIITGVRQTPAYTTSEPHYINYTNRIYTVPETTFETPEYVKPEPLETIREQNLRLVDELGFEQALLVILDRIVGEK